MCLVDWGNCQGTWLVKEFSLLHRELTEWCLSCLVFHGRPLGKPSAVQERRRGGMRLHAFPESLTLANYSISLSLSLLLCLIELLVEVGQMCEQCLVWGLVPTPPLGSLGHHSVSTCCIPAVGHILYMLSHSTLSR